MDAWVVAGFERRACWRSGVLRRWWRSDVLFKYEHVVYASLICFVQTHTFYLGHYWAAIHSLWVGCLAMAGVAVHIDSLLDPDRQRTVLAEDADTVLLVHRPAPEARSAVVEAVVGGLWRGWRTWRVWAAVLEGWLNSTTTVLAGVVESHRTLFVSLVMVHSATNIRQGWH